MAFLYQYKQEPEEEVDNYIDKYEENVANLRKLGRDLDEETLALQLMENASLTDELSQLVLTGIDEKQANIFDQTKRSMRKYLGSNKTGLSIKGNKVIIKEEAFNTSQVDEDEEAMYTYNYNRRGGRGGRNNWRGSTSQRGSYSQRGSNNQRGTNQQTREKWNSFSFWR